MTTSALPQQHESAAERAAGPVPRILVVDDEPLLAELLSLALTYEGWDVHTAPDGRTALDLAEDLRPRLVILDVMLPDINGLEVLRLLRKTAHDVPVMFLTAMDSVEDRAAGLNAGGDDYLTKPFSLDDL